MEIRGIMKLAKRLMRKLTISFVLPFAIVFLLSGIAMECFKSGSYTIFSVLFVLTVLVPILTLEILGRLISKDLETAISIYIGYKMKIELNKKMLEKQTNSKKDIDLKL